MIGISEELTVIRPGGALSPRCAGVLEAALAGRQAEVLSRLEGPLTGRRLLFVVSLDEGGVNRGFYDLLAHLRTHPNCLDRCVGACWWTPRRSVHQGSGPGPGAGRQPCGLRLCGSPSGGRHWRSAELHGPGPKRWLFFGSGLPSGDGGSGGAGAGLLPPRLERPKLLALHASSRATSNTLALWGLVRTRLEERCDITEICLRNGTLEDCAGCPYTTCLHFGEQGGCFYGGVMVQEVYPAIREADALVLLCPNYNDALSANLTAAINRLTALYRTTSFADKAVFAIVVSGYSGGDIVACQAAGAMNMNKGFWLPANFCLLETANDKGEALALPGIQDRADRFAENMLCQLAY
ncbi:NAD(P)H-dependent oxidoreductase [Oscillibacter sp.]|uniref:NAD(P)H-dependent oxidoreductase n=1 Tax=Oscillibacter sp. TaxID=1945593 RepID=UPI002579570C|nr:NAD(P)H-dependent oxidoreductase [Oscillibacter sp.]